MVYNTMVQIANSSTLTQRIAAAAATQEIEDPVGWAQAHRWVLAAQPGWADAWAYAEDTKTIEENPDTGVREAVINESMILAAVQAIITEEATPPE